MENNKQNLQEQDAPLKNSDKAFVQVGKNGEPVIPEKAVQKEEDTQEEDRSTSLDKR